MRGDREVCIVTVTLSTTAMAMERVEPRDLELEVRARLARSCPGARVYVETSGRVGQHTATAEWADGTSLDRMERYDAVDTHVASAWSALRRW